MRMKGKKNKVYMYKKEKKREMQSHSWRGQPSVQLNGSTV